MSIQLPQAPLRTALVDPRTGQLNRDWYRWFAEVSRRVGGDSFTADELAILGDFAPAQDKGLHDRQDDAEIQAAFGDAVPMREADPALSDLFTDNNTAEVASQLALLALDVQTVNVLQAIVGELQKTVAYLQMEVAFTV